MFAFLVKFFVCVYLFKLPVIFLVCNHIYFSSVLLWIKIIVSIRSTRSDGLWESGRWRHTRDCDRGWRHHDRSLHSSVRREWRIHTAPVLGQYWLLVVCDSWRDRDPWHPNSAGTTGSSLLPVHRYVQVRFCEADVCACCLSYLFIWIRVLKVACGLVYEVGMLISDQCIICSFAVIIPAAAE